MYASIGGLAAGLGTVALVKGLEWTERGFDEGLGGVLPFGRWDLVLIVAVGGLLAGLIVRSLGNESRGHGVPDVMYAFEHSGGRMPWRVTVSGFLATLATIGAGGSAGQEGPSVHVGSGIASLVGSVFRVGPENRRLLVAVGAAGGISAVFNAPLTGSFFALEVVLRRFTIRNFSSVVLGAVLANVVYRGILGDEAALRSPAYSLDSGWEIPGYVVLGICTAVVAVLFVRTLYAVESLTRGLNIGAFGPALGGLLVGVIGVWHHQIIGTGEPQIASYLGGAGGARLLLLLAGLKILSTSLTLGSGGTGGVFMPSLFLGAALGGAFGGAADSLVPGIAAPGGAYAVAGMAGVFAGAASAPITALLLAFEVSQDYGLVVPLMVVVVISTAVSQLLMDETVYSEGLRRIGIDLSRERGPDRLERLRVADAFHQVPVVIAPEMPLASVRAAFASAARDILPVVDAGKVVGILSSRDLLASLEGRGAAGELLVRDIMAKPALTVRTGESLQTAVLRMDQEAVRALAVVEQDGTLAGVLDRADVLAAYARGGTPESEGERTLVHEIEQPEGRFLRVRVRAGGKLAQRAVRDLEFPPGSLIVSIRRGRRMLVPRSAMVLHPGDQLLILAEEEALPELQRKGIVAGGDERREGARRIFHWYRR